jgi:antitoxin MazE
MKAHIIKIGNSRGIRIPKLMIAQAGIKEEVEVNVEKNRLVISSARQPRAHWAEAFRRMASEGDDALLDSSLASGTSWDDEEWEWK